MVQIPVLDRLNIHTGPLTRKIPIFKVNQSFSNQIISKENIVVHHLDAHQWSSREIAPKFDFLKQFRVRFIILVVLPIVENFVTEVYQHVRIGGATNISTRQIKT